MAPRYRDLFPVVKKKFWVRGNRAGFCYNNATLIRLLLTLLLSLGMAVMPPLRTAAAGEPPPEHPATAGPIITDNAVPAPPGQFILQPYWSLGFVAGNTTANWRRVSARGNFASLEMPVKLVYGLAPNVEVNLVGVFFQNWAGQVEGTRFGGSRSASFAGLGDLYFTAKYQLLEETAWRPTVTAIFSVNFPTGHHYRLNPGRLGTDALGGGTFGFTPGLDLSKWVGPVYLYANLWYSFPTRDPKAVTNQQASPLLPALHGRDMITGNLAAELPLSSKWVALLEIYTTWNVGPLFRPSREVITHGVGVLPGLEYIFSPRWSAELGVAVDLAGKNSQFGYTPVFTVIMTY